MRTMSDRQNFHEFLERKAEIAVQEENAAQKRLSAAEAYMEIRRWEQKNTEVAFLSLVENSNLRYYRCIRRFNGLISLKKED